jgi:two-component system, cell cycle sensor histidine kinase and response regulator CckA
MHPHGPLPVALESARVQVARTAVTHQHSLTDALHEVASTAAAALNVARVSIWQFIDNRRAVRCDFLHEPGRQDVCAAAILHVADFPRYFQTIEHKRAVPISDVNSDQITEEFRRPYLEPLGITAMLDAPIFAHGIVTGIVCHEHIGETREWTTEECEFAASMADAVGRLYAEAGQLRVEGALGSYERQIEALHHQGMLGRMAVGIAHDVKNVLQVVGGNAELIRDHVMHDPDAIGFVEQIQGACDRAHGLVRSLMELGKTESRRPQVIDLPALFEQSASLLHMAAGALMTLDILAPPAVSRVFIDPVDFERMLINLAMNARDAMPTGGALRITAAETTRMRSGRERRFVVISVADTGSGMDAATAARIFEPFFTTKGSSGNGLGLTVVHHIVTLAGGLLEVESAVGQGTTMRVLLPAIAGPVD